MDELLPLLLGALVGLATAHARRRALLTPAGCLAAGWAATLASGELAASAWYVCADVALAAAGCAAALAARYVAVQHQLARRARTRRPA